MPLELGEALEEAGLNPDTGEAVEQTDAGSGAGEAAGGQQAAETTQPPSQPTATSAAATGQTPAAAAEAWSLRQQLQQLGLQGQYADDRTAWEALANNLRQREQTRVQELQELQRMAQIGQQYLHTLHQQQAAPPPAPAAKADEWWKVPAWNEADMAFLAKDKDGNVVAAPGAPPDLPHRYAQHQRWQAEMLGKFLRDPIGTIRPGLEKVIEEIAEKKAQERLGRYDEQQYAQQVVQGGSGWMYEQNNGQAVYDNYGRPVLSQAGRAFAGYVQYAQQQLGISDVRKQREYAEALVQRDALAAAYRSSAAGGAGNPAAAAAGADPAAANEALKRAAVGGGARRIPSAGGGAGTQPPARANGQRPRAKDLRLSYGDRLRAAMKDANVEPV